MSTYLHISSVQSVLVLRRFALRNFAHTNFYNEVYTLRLARHPKANSLIRNLPNKIEHVIAKTKTKDTTSPSQLIKPEEVQESVRLTLCFGVYLVEDFGFWHVFLCLILCGYKCNMFCCLYVSFQAIKLLIYNFFWLFFCLWEHNPQL
jgi:hypothetical protein